MTVTTTTTEVHRILTATQAGTECVCGAPAGDPCICPETRPGIHLARIARARAQGVITFADFAEILHGAVVCTGYTVVIDPLEGTPAA